MTVPVLTLTLFGRRVLVMLPPDSTPRKGYFLFLHGSLLSPENYTEYLRRVAGGGYVVIAPYYTMHVFASVEGTARSARAILDSLRRTYGVGRGCVGGHSMGALVALNMAEDFDCAVLLSLYLPPWMRPDSITVPTLLVSGERDILTPSNLHQMPLFHRIKADRALIVLPGGTHNAYLNGPVWGDFMAGWPPFGQRRFYRELAEATLRFMDTHITGRAREGPRARAR